MPCAPAFRLGCAQVPRKLTGRSQHAFGVLQGSVLYVTERTLPNGGYACMHVQIDSDWISSLSTYLFIYLSIYLPIYLSTYPSIHPSIHLNCIIFGQGQAGCCKQKAWLWQIGYDEERPGVARYIGKFRLCINLQKCRQRFSKPRNPVLEKILCSHFGHVWKVVVGCLLPRLPELDQ